MKKLYVLQHVAEETLGIWEEELKRWRVPYVCRRLWEGESLPKPEETLAAIVLGGPMNVDETKQYSFLLPEQEYLRKILEKQIPMLGVCLGAQLLAAVLGAKVAPGPKPEIGYTSVELTRTGAEDRLLLGFPMELPVFQWHEQGFELPAGAECLAGTNDYPIQAFRHGSAWGFQFHLEVTPKMVGEWAEKHAVILQQKHNLASTKLAEQAIASGQMVALYGRQLIRRFWDSATE